MRGPLPDLDDGLVGRFSDRLELLRLLRLQADVLQVVLDVLQQLVPGSRLHHRCHRRQQR